MYDNVIRTVSALLTEQGFPFRSIDLESYINNLWWRAPKKARDCREVAKMFRRNVHVALDGRRYADLLGMSE